LREIGLSGANVRPHHEAILQAMGKDRGQPGSYQEDLHKMLERLLHRSAQSPARHIGSTREAPGRSQRRPGSSLTRAGRSTPPLPLRLPDPPAP